MSYTNNNIPNNVLFNHGILPQTRTDLSSFDLSESLTTTIRTDNLYPVYWNELNPGDHLEVDIHALCRFMPMVAPIMSNIKLKFFAFFVPNRLLWKNWKQFLGAREYQTDADKVFTVPQVHVNTKKVSGTLFDYMGVPYTKEDTTVPVSALPFRAYNRIWNEWFRANLLQAPVVEQSGDEGDDFSNYSLLKKGKPLDRFTACLPTPQAVEPVTIGLSGDAKVMQPRNKAFNIAAEPSREGVGFMQGNVMYGNGGGDYRFQDQLMFKEKHYLPPSNADVDTNLYADLSAVTGITIEDLRRASALQVLLERDIRAGECYIDLLNAHWGVDVPDFLVGRSQYLGSTSAYINVEPIAQTSATGDVTAQGNLSATAYGSENDKLCEISTVEHGIFMILACVEGEQAYQQGLDRKFSRESRYDYPFPEFFNLGDEAVFTKELYLTGDTLTNNTVFGYAERYSDLRTGSNKVSGLMRSGVTGSLDMWHLYQNFGNAPKLNGEFIECNTPLTRALADTSQDSMLLNVFFDIKATRNLPVTTNPSLNLRF